MLFTNTHFRELNNKDYLIKKYKNADEFNKFIDKELEITNIDILLSYIINIDNSNNENIINTSNLESRELLLKANIGENKENLKEWIKINDEFNLSINFDRKIKLLIHLDKLCQHFYPYISNKKIISKPKVSYTEREEFDKIKKQLNFDKGKLLRFSNYIKDSIK